MIVAKIVLNSRFPRSNIVLLTSKGEKMGYIPEGAKWYIADIVVEMKTQNDPRNVVHTNIILIHAGSPEIAYEKAIKFGKDYESVYENPDGNLVKTVFRGLRDLNVIHDELEDGAELIYEEDVGISEDKLKNWITSKEQLGVFAPIDKPKDRPNYISGKIVEALKEKGFTRDELT